MSLRIKVQLLKGATNHQYVINTHNTVTFQSYDSTICIIDHEESKITFGADWDYSITTAKYRNEFLRQQGLPALANAVAIRKAINEGHFLHFTVIYDSGLR